MRFLLILRTENFFDNINHQKTGKQTNTQKHEMYILTRTYAIAHENQQINKRNTKLRTPHNTRHPYNHLSKSISKPYVRLIKKLKETNKPSKCYYEV